ncbi:MAG TPA: sulfotransferase [Solirubrobacteraceae bacterium]|jgi:hypothetical protein|nr:sulfotransferase [Solirubrobacteraceae bacterium]
MTRPTVVYVMGAGHSGSTILGVVLGNCAGFFYAGEVEEWVSGSGALSLGGNERADFWNAVGEQIDRGRAEALFAGEANRLVERSSSVLRIDRWAARRRLLRDYRRVAEQLLRVIADTARASHVVDTSHFPLRARELQKLKGVELFLIYLVRDPQGVIASSVRGISRREVAERRLRILTANAKLWLTHLVSLVVFLRHPRERRVFVRHEEFLADPEGIVRALLDRLGSSSAVPDLGALRPGIPFLGNTLIAAETISVTRSTRRPARWSRVTALAQLCWTPIHARLQPAARARRPSAADE